MLSRVTSISGTFEDFSEGSTHLSGTFEDFSGCFILLPRYRYLFALYQEVLFFYQELLETFQDVQFIYQRLLRYFRFWSRYSSGKEIAPPKGAAIFSLFLFIS